MKRVEVKPLKAEITLGLNKLYSENKNTLQDVINASSSSQKKLSDELNIKLSAKVTPCRIVFSGQDEESLTIGFINYPMFPVEEVEFCRGVEFIAIQLMDRLEQNRIVIEYADKTVMLEKSEKIDPKISL